MNNSKNFLNLGDQEIKGKSFLNIFFINDTQLELENIIEKIFHGEKYLQETYLRKQDGSSAFVQFMCFPIFLNGDIVGAFILIIDITTIKEAEENMKIAKEMAELANKMKDTFIANISHEIRTPLNAILGYTSLVQETVEKYLVEDEKFYFDVIRSAGNRLMRTVEMIMNYSRIVSGDFPVNKQKLNLTQIIQNLYNEFSYTASIKNLDFKFENECGEVFIFADNYCTTQAIANVIDNAIKYTKNGFVKVKLKRDENQNLILEVEDTGIGISPEYQKKNF